MDRGRGFGYLVVSPAGAPEPSLAIAGCRAGAVGVLNLEFAADAATARAALDRLAALGHGPYGVLVDGDDQALFEVALEKREPRPSVVVLTVPESTSLAERVAAIHAVGSAAYVVAPSLDVAEAAEAAGADAVIAKGHEAGGWVGDETAFVLLQRLLPRIHRPIWVQGGVGVHTAAASVVAGAAGVVLDSQVLLARESPLPEAVRTRLAALDGSETICYGAAFGAGFRAYARPNLPISDVLRDLETTALLSDEPAARVRSGWRQALRSRVGWNDPERQVLAVGQDVYFAARLARKFGTVGGILAGIRQAIDEHLAVAQERRPLAEDAALARSHGTRYPIVQGPMTRVSDRAEFAEAVAEGGALPFLALALMRAPEVEALLVQTRERLGARPWGVGILGFVPPDLRAEQLEVIRRIRPPFALIAGGRSDQARLLEADGIRTYLHVPSPGLLQMFLQDGARRFIFEGRECGGHVGPRTSFVLWESMIEVILEHVATSRSDDEYHVLFAGGVHDGLSAAMVAALAAPLVASGVRIGVLIGTAYLFTEEAVRAGAIVPGFQEVAIACDRTVLLESGPGHATRCAPSDFVEDFAREKRALLHAGLASEDVRQRLEELNVGRLRIASKGVDRHPLYGKDPAAPRLVPVSAEEQRRRGMYMIGQVAVLRDKVGSIAQLHDDVSAGSSLRLATVALSPDEPEPAPPPAAVAIVGMACILPGAPDLRTFWANILNKIDAVTEVPPERWDWRRYYDPDKSAPDKIYSRWGGFIGDVPFDPLEFGMPPSSLASIEPFQLLALLVVRDALRDAGLDRRAFPRERTSVILGAGGGSGDLTIGYMVRSTLPMLFGETAAPLTKRLDPFLPQWTEDSFPGLLLNVAAGRAANRFDFGGLNYTVDAACASSLAAVYQGVRELEQRTSDVAIVGGVDAIQNPFAFLAFSKTQALSPMGRCRTFDAQADGIAISEGFAVLVLKRLADAERDGDRIYAVIRGVGGSSDGRDRSMTAPRPEGQIRALRRAYAQAGFSPATVGLIEAHGTGTVAGDQAEVEALTRYFGQAGARTQRTALGSVKSMIGHTKATAGVAGLVKVALALYHQILPPTLGVTQPNPKANFPASPFYVNSETRPWIQGVDSHPRRAGVSAFGFGGTNFHVVVEEYADGFLPPASAAIDPWPAELLVWQGQSRDELRQAVRDLRQQLERGAQPRLADLAFSLARRVRSGADSATIERQGDPAAPRPTLAIVAQSTSDLLEKLRVAEAGLDGTAERLHDNRGIHFAQVPFGGAGRVAFLFPGQGSQYVTMGRDVALAFPEARAAFEIGDRVLADRLPQPLSRYVFPPPWFDADEERRHQAALTETDIAQPALGAVDLALLRVLRWLGLEPDLVAGHSYGEFVALCAAGCFSESTLFELSEARGRFIRDGATEDSGTMAAVDAGPDVLRPLLADLDVTLANLNAPKQTVISGKRDVIEQAVARCLSHGLRPRLLPVACAFHSPLVAPAQQRLAALLRRVDVAPPRIPVYSNTTATRYPEDPPRIVELLADHLIRPVEFVREVTAMYEDGARIFVEVGPKSVLTGLVSRILEGQPFLAVALDQAGRPGLVQLLHGLAALAAEGATLDLGKLYRGRNVRLLDLAKLESETGHPRLTPTTWLVNGGGARPASQTIDVAARAPVPVALLAPTEQAPTRRESQAHSTSPAPSASPARPAVGPSITRQGGPMKVAADHATDETARPADGRPRSPGGPAPAERAVAVAPSFDAESPDETPAIGRPSDPAVVAEPPLLTPAEATTEVMRQFQGVMQRFLETQQAVMLAYLQGGRRVGPALASGPWPAPSVVASPRVPPRLEAAAARPAAPLRPTTNGHHDETAHAAPREGTSQPHAPELRRDTPVAAPKPEPAPARAAPSLTPSAAPSAESGAAPLTLERLTEQLLGVVAERTGYPTEMLGLDADLEADLGIDSIKRVEIVGTIVRSLALSLDQTVDMEKLTGSRTLRQLAERLFALASPTERPVEAVGSATNGSSSRRDAAREGDQRPFDLSPSGTTIGRFTLRVVPAPAITRTAELARSGVVVITDDETGVSVRLARRLTEQGYRTLRLRHGGPERGEAPDLIALDLASPAAIENFLASWHERFGPASALIHLAALRPGAAELGLTPASWRRRLAVDLEAFFLLAKGLRLDLEQAALDGGAAVVAVTSMGGAFASDAGSLDFFPGHGSLTGWLKTVAQEWPTIRVKAIDVGPEQPETVAEQVLNEVFAADRLVEVGYQNGRRVRLELAPASLAGRAPRLDLDERAVILVTGGARGITAEVSLELLKHVRPTLVVVGRSPLPTAPEPPELATVTDPRALKLAIVEQQRRAGRTPTPVQVEEIAGRLRRAREMRRNLELLQQSGARVEYHACDVSDADAFGRLIDQVYQTHGRLDGVIHGAGIIEDKLVRDKTLDSFRRVVRTKLDSTLVLAARLRPEGLRFLVLFSSIAARVGNRGQADYGAANEILNKLAGWLKRRWPGRVVAIGWGPWGTLGMATPEVQRQLAERGIDVVPLEIGRAMLVAELAAGAPNEVEVVIAGGAAVAPTAESGEPMGARP